MNPTSKDRRLTRRRHDRMLAGVCGGLADYLGVDATVVRLLTVLATLLGLGSLVIGYLAAWLLMPERESDWPTGP